MVARMAAVDAVTGLRLGDIAEIGAVLSAAFLLLV